MANPTDLQGMLTSQLLQPQAQAAIPSTYEQRMLQQGQKFATGLRRGIGAMTGSDTRTTAEKAQAMMANLDINDPKDQPKILQLVNSINPAQAPKLVAAFAQQKRQRDEKQSGIDAKNTSREKFAEYLDRTYPNKGYGALALQGLITPANMKNFIKEADKERKTQVISVSVDGVNKQRLVDSVSGVKIMEWDSAKTGTADPNQPTYITKEVIKNGQKKSVMFKRVGDNVTEVATLGATTIKDGEDYEKVEITKADGQAYIQFLDLSKPEGKRLVHEIKSNENRETVEEVDSATGQTIKYSMLPNGSDKIRFGVVKPASFEIKPNDDGTYNVWNNTLGRYERENVATQESAEQLIVKKQQTNRKLIELDMQIGFIDEAKALLGGFPDAILHPLMRYAPTTDALKLEKKVKAIKSFIGKNTLMEMRKGSAVGATGLGALNLKELEMVQASLDELDPLVGDEAFLKQLNKVKKHYQGWRASLMGRPEDIDWSNPAYREFTRTVTGADGVPRLYYTLSDEKGAPLRGPDGKILYYEANIREEG
jgi:hypothetical protein